MQELYKQETLRNYMEIGSAQTVNGRTVSRMDNYCLIEDNERMFCDDAISEQSVLLSINPKWAYLIENGEKTIEVRKTIPKRIANEHKPFRVYLYVTKREYKLLQIMRDGDENYGEIYHGKPVFITTFKNNDYWQRETQKVVGECVCDFITGMMLNPLTGEWDTDGTCLTEKEMNKYSGGKYLYGWHLRDVVIYKNPKSLEEFGMKRPPQSWCYVK